MNEQIRSIAEQQFAAKQERRAKLALEPVEKKYEMLVKLQEIASQLAKQKGRTARKPFPPAK